MQVLKTSMVGRKVWLFQQRSFTTQEDLHNCFSFRPWESDPAWLAEHCSDAIGWVEAEVLSLLSNSSSMTVGLTLALPSGAILPFVTFDMVMWTPPKRPPNLLDARPDRPPKVPEEWPHCDLYSGETPELEWTPEVWEAELGRVFRDGGYIVDGTHGVQVLCGSFEMASYIRDLILEDRGWPDPEGPALSEQG